MAVGFALTLMLSTNCNYAGAQQATYQAPSADTVSMVDVPAAPVLQGATCGTIGPQPESDAVVVPVSTDPVAQPMRASGAVTAGNFDGGQFLRNFSSDLDQFKGKIAEKAFSFLESIQSSSGRKDATVIAPGGYSAIRHPASVSPAVF